MVHVLIILALIPFALFGCMVIFGLSMAALGLVVRSIAAAEKRQRAREARALAARTEYKKAAKLRAAALRERHGVGGAIAIRLARVVGVVMLVPIGVMLLIAGQRLFHFH